MKRFLVNIIAGASAILAASHLHAVTIISVTGPPDGAYGFGTNASQAVGASWTQSDPFANVSINAVLEAIFENTTGTAYLTNQIGAGTTAANEIASAPFVFPVSRADTNLFSGLTLPAGTYYLVLSTASNGFWDFTNTQTVTTAPGVSFNSDYVSTSTNAYPPANNFNSTNAGFLFSVTGTSVPEPPIMSILLISGLILSGLAFQRRQ